MLKRTFFLLLFCICSNVLVHAQRVELLKDTMVMNSSLQYVPLKSAIKTGKMNVLFFIDNICEGCMDQTDILEKYFSKNAVPSNMNCMIVFSDKVRNKSELSEFATSETSFASIYIDTNEVYSRFLKLSNNPIVYFVNDQGRIVYTHSESKAMPGNKIREVADGFFTGRLKPEQLSFDKDWIPCNRDTATYYRQYTWNNITKRYVLTDYYKNGNPQMKGQYSRLNPLVSDGAFSFYRNDGSLESTRNYQDDVFAGQWIYYDSSGQAFEWFQYKDGKYYGPYKIIYEDDTYMTGQFLDGFRTGTWKGYSATGKTLLENTWVKGKMNGMFKCWNLEGRPFLKVNMKDDQVVFDTIPLLVYDNGQPIADVFNISSDKKAASFRYYDEKGTMVTTRTWLGNDKIKMMYYTESGNPIAEYEIDIKKKSLDGTFTYWYASGKKKYEIKYVNNIAQTGARIWYENGKIKEYYDPADKKIKYFDESGNPKTYMDNSEMSTLVNNTSWAKERAEKVMENSEQFYTIIKNLTL